MLNKKTVEDVDVRGKRVLVRVDFNVPLKGTDTITDDTRIEAALKTIEYLIERDARVILMSHLEGKKGVDVMTLKMDPVAARLAELLKRPVKKLNDCVGPEVEAAVAALAPGDVVLLENTRHHEGEKTNDDAFADQLARLGDVYVNDAFGAAHRKHASTVGVTRTLPAVAGFLMVRELEKLGDALSTPRKDFVAVLGGAKLEGKLPVIENLLPKVKALLVGGGMAYTFLKAQGYEIGKSLLDKDFLDDARRILKTAAEQGYRLELPIDVVVTDDFEGATTAVTVPINAIPADQEGVDIGEKTIARYSEILREARTVVWNGPMGVFEKPRFAEGTRAIAQVAAEISEAGARVIVGGGDSAAAATQMGFADRIDHISTGGGASLEFLEGKALPGVVALNDR